MKITKRQLRRIIKEEKENILSEQPTHHRQILLVELMNIVDQLLSIMDTESVALELEGLAEDIRSK